MDIETAREYCLAKKAVTECLPFDEYSLVMIWSPPTKFA